jgi:4-hydroxy-4-methyl-2-oxoglutarate aldolase
MPESLVNRLLAVGVCSLSDALDKLGLDGQCLGIMPFGPAMKLAGPAFTIRMVPVGQSGGVVGDYIDDVGEGDIVVIDNDGRRDATVWGDILTTVASARKIGGTVIDGVCRDIQASLTVGYPIFALANTMRTGKDRVTADAYNVTVQVSGVRIEAGDWLVGDSDGVIAIPRDRLQEVLEIAEEISRIEEKIIASVRAGSRLDEARKALKYHSLQTASPKP